MTAVRYLIEHLTRYSYSARVSTSQHLAYLSPRALARQSLLEHSLTIDPEPSERLERQDYFGNRVCQFTVLSPHRSLAVTGRSIVEVADTSSPIDAARSPAWEDVSAHLAYQRATPAHEAHQFAYRSPYVVGTPEIEVFARRCFTAGAPLLVAALDLMHCIHEEFTFDPEATTITTPVSRVLGDRHGVCQDFAHLQIACLRTLGLPARYVSGYLLTDPPKGQPRLVGADASHAWLAVHCPVNGWVDLDPTNDMIADSRHITVAWGRDYGDVSPLRGVILGGAEHRLEVGVSVVPAPPDASSPPA